ncbi:MAG: hypothetical protein AABW88_00205 [Nanoarchaeota archaeon]
MELRQILTQEQVRDETEEKIAEVRKYTPTAKELRDMRKSAHYWEVWQGLPDVEFKEVLSRGSYNSLQYEREDVGIWVNRDAVSAARQNPNAIYTVMVRTKKDKLIAPLKMVYDVSPSKFTLERTIQTAIELNKEKRK